MVTVILEKNLLCVQKQCLSLINFSKIFSQLFFYLFVYSSKFTVKTHFQLCIWSQPRYQGFLPFFFYASRRLNLVTKNSFLSFFYTSRRQYLKKKQIGDEVAIWSFWFFSVFFVSFLWELHWPFNKEAPQTQKETYR